MIWFQRQSTSVAIINTTVPLYVFLLSSLSLRFSLFWVPTPGLLHVWAWPLQSHSQLAVIWLQQNSQAGCMRRRHHSEIAHTVQYGHSSCWVRKTSIQTERGDGGERSEKNVGDMKICKGVREQSVNPWKMQQCLVLCVLLWWHVWNWNVIRCYIWLLSLAHTHTHSHTWYLKTLKEHKHISNHPSNNPQLAIANWWNNKLSSSIRSFPPNLCNKCSPFKL